MYTYLHDAYLICIAYYICSQAVKSQKELADRVSSSVLSVCLTLYKKKVL